MLRYKKREDEPRRIPGPDDQELTRRRELIRKQAVIDFGGTP